MEAKFSELLWKTIVRVESTEEKISFFTETGEYRLSHFQGCCESVRVESIEGDLDSLVGSPLLVAEESVNDSMSRLESTAYDDRSRTWTFYKLATIKGHVDIRWIGESNGFYSESVDFDFFPKAES